MQAFFMFKINQGRIMKQQLVKYAFFIIAWFAIAFGMLGIVLPLLPATPFFILAAFSFSKSSPRFQHWLLNLPGIGNDLERWQSDKKIEKKRKPIIYISIVVSFVISISLLTAQPYLQAMLIALMAILLIFIRKLPEY